ncbi:hypothetical protein Tco_1352724 [Tanacetum coccineum]
MPLLGGKDFPLQKLTPTLYDPLELSDRYRSLNGSADPPHVPSPKNSYSKIIPRSSWFLSSSDVIPQVQSHFLTMTLSIPFYPLSDSLPPFGDSDFLLLEEADAFLALEDDPTSPEVDDSYYDSEGDILLLEAILTMIPSPTPPLPTQGNLFAKNFRKRT